MSFKFEKLIIWQNSMTLAKLFLMSPLISRLKKNLISLRRYDAQQIPLDSISPKEAFCRAIPNLKDFLVIQ